jgi:hypothetical protein
LLGLLVASFLAAFMSTMDSHLNLASAYVVNDVYRRFIRPDGSEAHYMAIARLTGVGVLLIALLFAAFSTSVRGMFDAFSALYSGLGIVYVLRWFWWRINAWSEITALLASGLTTLALYLAPGWAVPFLPAVLVVDGQPVFAGQLLIIVPVTLVLVLTVTFATRPTDPARLADFFAKVRPLGAWGPVTKPDDWTPSGAGAWLRLAVAWLSGLAFVMCCVLLPSSLLGGDGGRWWIWALGALAGLVVLRWSLPMLRIRHVSSTP